MISGQSLTCPKGTSLTFEIDMDTGSDLTGATAQWALAESWFDQAKVYLTKTGTGDGLFIGQDAGIWKITVNLAPSDTLDVPSGLLFHDCKVLLQSGDVEDVANGPFSLAPSVNILDTNAPITRNLHALQALGRLGQNVPLTVSQLARNLLATQSLFGLGQSAAGTVTGSSLVFSADFTSISTLPAEISFARASNAMVYDSTGALIYAPNNLALNSQAFSSWTVAGSASVTSDTMLAPDGTTTADTLSNTSAFNGVSQNISSTGARLIFSAYFLKTSGATLFPGISVQVTGTYASAAVNTNTGVATARTGEVPSSITVTSVGNFWRVAVKSTTASDGNITAYIYPAVNTDASATWTGGNGSTVIWGAQIEAVTYETDSRTYNPTTTAAYYGPRFDHAWNGSAWVATGLLIEEQRTNLFLQSGSPANQTVTVANGTDYTVSFFGTGALTLSGAATQTVTGSGANVRTLYTFTASTTSLVIAVSGTVTYPNVEAGDFATFYIPTTTAAVTRSADIAQLMGAALTALQGVSGSLIVENAAFIDNLNIPIVASTSGADSIWLYIRGAGPYSASSYNGAQIVDSTTIASFVGTHREGLSWSGAGRSVVVDGGTVGTDANSGNFGSTGAAALGASVAFAGLFSGHYRSLAIYNVRLSNSDLQTKSVVGAPF